MRFHNETILVRMASGCAAWFYCFCSNQTGDERLADYLLSINYIYIHCDCTPICRLTMPLRSTSCTATLRCVADKP